MRMPNEFIYVVNVLPQLLYIPVERHKDFIRDKKRELLCTALEEHPARCYEAIRFEIQNSVARVYEEIENCFKRADGRYIYDGEFVSREFLCQKFANLPFRIVMSIYVREEYLEQEANDETDAVRR